MELNPDFLTTSVTASCSLFLRYPLFSCRLLADPQTHRHCFILRLAENNKAPKNLFIDFAWQDFLMKQDQSSSRRSAERTFIDFITTQGIVQRQRVCMPFFSRHYSMMCSLFHMFLSLKGSQCVFKWLLLAGKKCQCHVLSCTNQNLRLLGYCRWNLIKPRPQVVIWQIFLEINDKHVEGNY